MPLCAPSPAILIADPDCCDARHSFAEAEAKIGDKQLSAQEGWFRSDKPIKKTQLYRYMLVLRNAEGRVRCFSPAHRTASSPGSYDLATDGYKVRLDKDDAWSEATSHFSKTSADEASDGWAAQHVHELDNTRLRIVHLVTGETPKAKLLEFWYDLPAKRVLTVRTSDTPAVKLTGLWVEKAPENMPA